MTGKLESILRDEYCTLTDTIALLADAHPEHELEDVIWIVQTAYRAWYNEERNLPIGAVGQEDTEAEVPDMLDCA